MAFHCLVLHSSPDKNVIFKKYLFIFLSVLYEKKYVCLPLISDYVWWFYIVISKKIPIVCASSLAVSSWVERAFPFICHICWALKLMGCFWSMEIGENAAAVTISKKRYLGVGCIYAFYWSISSWKFVNVKLQLECWTASLNMAGQKIFLYTWHSRRLCHLIKKKIELTVEST